MMRFIVLASYLICGIVLACQTDDDPMDENATAEPVESDQELDSLLNLLNTAQNLNRDAWQKPLEVIQYLGDLKGKKIADIGAGSGYFTFLLPPQGAEVIAIDIDPYAIEGIDQTMSLPNYPIEYRRNIELRLVEEDDPQLEPNEVDGIMIINTISFIEDRAPYLDKLMTGLKPGGRLLIVDYKTKRIPFDIPFDERVPLFQIENELYEAGFVNILADDCVLAYQYLIRAEKRTEL